ncbi:MAG: hypothetical protein EXR70_02460 [Deltaproteobacteria bacterium]|nr:hypothetical protein [Deltaproteobacteria bacterium]
MESLFIWIVMIAGAAIAMLGVFLVASEKELKKKRQELDTVLAKLEGGTPMTAAESPASSSGNRTELVELRARNQELERNLAAAASHSESGKSSDEELTMALRNVEIAQTNAQWLQSTNEKLKNELDDLQKRFETNSAQHHAVPQAANSASADERQRQLENEVADLQQQLADQRAKIRDVENLEHKLENVDAIEMNHREEKHSLEARIAELEKELAVATINANEFETLTQRLAESERFLQSLRAERQSFDEELATWEARAKSAEDDSRRLTALREPFDKLLAKQALLEEQQREYQQALAELSKVVAKPEVSTSPVAGFNEFRAAPLAELQTTTNERNFTEDAAIATSEQVIAAANSDKKPRRLFGLFPAVIMVAAGGTLAAGLWHMNNSGTTAPASVTASALPEHRQLKVEAPPVVAVDTVEAKKIDEPAASESQATPPNAERKVAPVKPIQTARIEANISGTYEVTHSSRVYTAPSELSQAMGEVEPGTKVSVVSGKNGWLEIHSKYGRPPGYIRKDSARLAAAN